MTEEINKGCKFQGDCIEYKDISYLKIMPICAIHELSIACHDKENKCKYYQVYKQLKRLEQENAELKEELHSLNCNANCYKYKEANKYKQALEEIREIAKENIKEKVHNPDIDIILDIINEIIGD